MTAPTHSRLPPRPEQQPEWYVDSTANITEALGFLKDWVTTLLSLQTILIAVFAVVAGIKGLDEFRFFSSGQIGFFSAAAFSSLASIYCGMILLKILPGAAQRKPTRDTVNQRYWDIYSIQNIDDQRDIMFWVRWFRLFFIGAVAMLVLFIVSPIMAMAFK